VNVSLLPETPVKNPIFTYTLPYTLLSDTCKSLKANNDHELQSSHNPLVLGSNPSSPSFLTLERCHASIIAEDRGATRLLLNILSGMNKPKGLWLQKKNCVDEAQKYASRSEWQKSNPLSYRYACLYGWLDDCASHMLKAKKKPNGYWDKRNCRAASIRASAHSGAQPPHSHSTVDERCKLP